MKRPLGILCLILLTLLIASYASAAPAVQEQQPVIAQPAQGAPVRGVVQIVGTAVHPQFQRYELYYAPYPVPSDQSWIFIGDAHMNQQPLGLLGTWDSRSVPDGTSRCACVVRVDGNYIDSDSVRVLVANTRPPGRRRRKNPRRQNLPSPRNLSYQHKPSRRPRLRLPCRPAKERPPRS